ncbi:MAG: NACHT domain-containing protein [Oculatellaceae cyanobacterium bins.114]|nr:NACHT domain-containing protein [Oculatellaceae cyanobacterium bins.114]
MSPNRLQLTNDGLKVANLALNEIFDGNKTRLAREAGVDRTTVFRFFNRANLEYEKFDAICAALDTIAEQIGAEPNGATIADENDDLETLVKQVRKSVQHRIQNDCGVMQLLVTSRNVETGGVYIDAQLVKPHASESSIADEESLQGEADDINFDRFGFRVLNSQRFAGETVAQHHERLFVYGKPGSGKTTYLQWLALRCSQGSFFSNYVPIFLIFKDFAEAERQPTLQNYIEQYLASCRVNNPTTVTHRLLMEGRVLLLLDGLDEVQESDRRRVQNQTQEIVTRFNKCRFVFSCRPPLRMRLPGFEEVVIADFNRRQIAAFSQRWFEIIDQADRSSQFMDRLSRNIALAELARTPLLLTLLCLVFDSDGQFPRTRSDLYQRGIEILLEQWDVFRNVERNNSVQDAHYQLLKPRAKKVLLSYIATKFFLEQKIFFWKRDVELIIEGFFEKVYKIDPIHISASAILQTIELQHGLLVARTSNYCSFSHLTFQEYFTANYLVSNQKYDVVYKHITENRWRFVIELIAELLDESSIDSFIENCKQSLDIFVDSKKKLCDFLKWINTFVNSLAHTVPLDQPYKHTLLRAWYFVFTIEDTGATSSLVSASRGKFDFPDYSTATSIISSKALDLHLLFYRAFHASSTQHELFLNVVKKIYEKVKGSDVQMETSLEGWLIQIEKDLSNYPHARDWWKFRQSYWQDRIQKLMLLRLNLRCDWNFSEEEKNALRQYYDATKLLSECMNRSRKTSDETYHKITRNLLKLGIEEEI